ncbi:restriction endonuclease subunit S [Aeromonas veronii]
MSELVSTSQQGLVGKYQPYQEYKDSGVEWLGNVPSHWTVTAVKRFASFTTGWTPPTGNDAYFGGEHLWANISDVGHRVLSTTAKTITDAGVRATRIKKSPKGSLLFSFKLSIGLVSIVGEDMYTNEAIATFLPSETFNISYMYWAAPLFIPQNAEENIYGAKLLNQERIGNASFVLPTPKEQRTIAAFLDYETARIDRLIAQQQRLIELLKEKRQAVISHAVTKGLNPDAPMKNSGVEWLGQVPNHWEVRKLCHVVDENRQIMYGIVLPGPNVNEGVMIVKGGDVKPGRLCPSQLCRTTPEIEGKYARSRLRAGDLVYSIRGTIGDVEIVPKEIDGANLTQDAARIAPAVGYSNLWLKYVMESSSTFCQLEVGSLGAAVKGINIRDLKKAIIPVPPVKERLEIEHYIDANVNKLCRLQKYAFKQVELLKEHRFALISAAVTGKIDLRGWTPSAEEAAA